MWGLVGAAWAAPMVALEVTGPAGTIVLSEEATLPADRTLSSPDGGHLLRISAVTGPDGGAVVELTAGKPKGGQPKPKGVRSFVLAPWAEQAETLVYREATWTVTATLGSTWDPPEVPEVAVDPHRYVLVWDDAGLLASPKKPASAVRERELPGRTDATDQASPMRYVDAWGTSHLEVETIPTPGDAHCQTGGPPLQPWALQYYVAVGDVVPQVTAREVASRLPDGTGYRVAAGVPVVAQGDGLYRVVTGGLSFLVQIMEEDLDGSYHPSVHFPREGQSSFAPGVIGNTALGEVRWTGTEPLPIAGLSGIRAPVATVRVPCAEVQLRPTVLPR